MTVPTPCVQEFWYGCAERWSARMLPRIMVSYNTIRRWRKPWDASVRTMEDSGAYEVILTHGRYPWSPAEYACGIALWQPEVAWTMDYPCEPSVRAKGGYTCVEAQAKTNDNTRALRDLGADVQSVVQGWEVEDYLTNLDLLRGDGLLTPRLGIGSICRRGRTREIVRIVRAIRANTPSWVKLHGFGVKTAVLGTEAKFDLFSVDSSSWRFPVFKHYDGVKHRPIEFKAPILRAYVDRMEGMLCPPDPLGAFA